MAENEECTEQQKMMIEDKVIEILKSSDMNNTTEAKVRKLASDQLGLDLSQPNYKKIVRQIVNSYITEQQEEPENKKQEVDENVEQELEVGVEKEEVQERGECAKEYDDNGDLIICRLSNKRRVTWGEFKGKTFLSIREYFEKEGKELPSSKGMALTADQWACLRENIPAIEEAIRKIGSS